VEAMIKLYDEIKGKVKVEKVWTVEQFINLTKEEEEEYWRLYNKAREVQPSFLTISEDSGAIHYCPFTKHYIVADFDYNDFNECYTMNIYRIDGKYLLASYDNIEVIRKEDFKNLLYYHAQRWFGNTSFSFHYPLTSKIRIIKHLYPKEWKKILKWLLTEYEDKLVKRTFTIYEFIDFLEEIEKMLKEDWRQRWLEDLCQRTGKPARITIVV
jgi:L-rhamnose mutarotase